MVDESKKLRVAIEEIALIQDVVDVQLRRDPRGTHRKGIDSMSVPSGG